MYSVCRIIGSSFLFCALNVDLQLLAFVLRRDFAKRCELHLHSMALTQATSMSICLCLGSSRDLLQFRCTMSAINDWLMIAIDADLQKSMETRVEPQTLPCNRNPANLKKRLDRLLCKLGGMFRKRCPFIMRFNYDSSCGSMTLTHKEYCYPT